MARICDLHNSNAYAASSGIDEFLEVSLAPAEDPADFTVAFYDQDGAARLVVELTDPRVWVSFDARSDECVYVLSAANLPILLSDPDGRQTGTFEAAALVNSAEAEVISFHDIGGGSRNILVLNGPAAGAVSDSFAASTVAAGGTRSIRFNQPDPGGVALTPAAPGAIGMTCFAAGARIMTPSGERAVEDLARGDMVMTLDSGARPIRWIGERRVAARGDMAPIHFAAGALGYGRELLVSPQHRMLVSAPELELLAGTSEVLVSAMYLVNGRDITIRPGGWVSYYHFMFDRHELVWANGVPAESFYLAERNVSSMTPQMRAEFASLFPELLDEDGAFGDLARPVLQGWELQAFTHTAAAA